jgi:hypothetical protein
MLIVDGLAGRARGGGGGGDDRVLWLSFAQQKKEPLAFTGGEKKWIANSKVCM